MNHSETRLPPLPAFPVISITQEENRIVGRSQGTSPVVVVPERPVEELSREETHDMGLNIVQELIDQLGTTDAIRVNVTSFTGDAFKMYYDPSTQMLEEIPEAAQPAATRSIRAKGQPKGMFASLSRPLRTSLAIGLGLLLLVALALGVRVFSGGGADDEALPDPAQLPISAPAGWDTYADYVVDATAAPITVNDELIYALDSTVIRLAGDNGKETGRTNAPFAVKDIYYTHGLGENIIAVGGSGKEAAIGPIGGEITEIEPPTDHATLRWVSGVPVFESTGFVYIPDAEGNLTRLVQPADSEPMVVHDKTAWFFSAVEPKAWLITSDAPELPESIAIPEVPGYAYQGPITGVQNTVIAHWAKEGQRSDARLELLETNNQGGLENPRSIVGAASANSLTVDAQRGKVLTQGLFIDVKTNQAMKVSTAAKYGAGYAWTTGTESSRISTDSEVINWQLPTGSTSSAIPSTLDPQGRAAVLYKPSNSDLPSRLYILKTKED